MNRFDLSVALAATFLFAAPTLAAQQRVSEISGTVRAEDGGAVSGATVVVEGSAESGTITDGSGRYRISVSPAGTVVVRVQALGFQPAERELAFDGGSVNVDFRLRVSPVALSPLTVIAATRTGTAAATLPVKVEVVDQVEVALQQTLVESPTEILANVLPSFSPPRQKLSTAGESFRGRRPLFLIDGVPQSNPLRDGRRDGFTIDPEMIERVEVIFGANAIQGLGATGGIINYVTINPPESGRLEQRASVRTSSGDGFEGDGFGWRGSYMAGKRFGDIDLLVSGSYEARGLQYDARDRAIGIDNVQGDVADSHSRNLLAKVGWEPAENQRFQLMVNDFRLAQEGNFDLVAGDRVAGVPALAVSGAPEGEEPVNDVTTASLDYTNGAIAGGQFSAKAYYQDFSALFGGGRFGTFQDPTIGPVGELFDQSENNSEKIGSRLTFSRSGVLSEMVGLIAGFDFIRDRTFQRLVQTNRNWVPETEFFNYAPFAQFDVEPIDLLTLSGGIRYEIASLSVDDFTTLAGNRSDLTTVEVAGGSPSFDEALFNVGGVLTPVSGLRLYGTFAQAFTMPDVGRVLRGVSEAGTEVEDFLALNPIKTDNVEFGGSWGSEAGLVGATYFVSTSDFGSRLVANADGIFEVRREPTETRGWEFNARVRAMPSLALNGAWSLLEGSFDGDRDGTLESDLGAADIGPNRLNLSADARPLENVRVRLQFFHFFDRDFEDGDGAITAEFEGYSTVDAALSTFFGPSTFTLSVSNLLDEQYITYYGQAATDRGDRFFAGRGRTLSLHIDTRF